MSINFTKLSFQEAIDYFRQKIQLPTETWTDIWEGMHSRAFVVAGAMKDELLSDFFSAIDKAISEGTTIADFRKAFDETVARNGWSYKGERGWRTGVIFNTNLRTAYATGNYKQMMATRESRPYWRYIGGLSEHPRPLHLEWNGTVLPADDPWWDTHFVPNGWGCKCQIVSHSLEELQRDGREVSDSAPDNGTYQWTNPDTGEVIDIPNGIDPGWAYNPGKTAWGQQLSDDVMSAWQSQGAKAWERLTPGDWESNSLPNEIPLDNAVASLDYTIARIPEGMESVLREILGGEEKAYSFQSGNFRYDILVNAHTLAGHIDPNRAPYIPFLPETLENPYEVWLSFERHKGTGQVVLRQRIIKAIQIDRGRYMLVVTNAVNGIMEAWTFLPTSDPGYINNQRVGKLIWKR